MADKCLAKPSLLLMALYSLQFLAFTGRETQQQFSNSKHSRFYWTKKHFISEGYFVCCCSEWYLVCYCFFLSNSPGGHVFSFKNKSVSCIWVAIPADWIILHWYACGADTRSVYGHVITKFSRIGRLPHFLSYGAPPMGGAKRRAWSSAIRKPRLISRRVGGAPLAPSP